jgi:hypothetical protein
MSEWWIIAGLGAVWLGWQIVWVAPVPRQLRRGDVPRAEKGTAAAFNLFWIDQYGWIGLTLLALGAIAIARGVL